MKRWLALWLLVCFPALAQPYPTTPLGNATVAGTLAVTGATTLGVVSATNLPLNVKEAPYNAKCDGTTDDTSAIQSAINVGVASGQSFTLLLPAGACKTTAALTVHPTASSGQNVAIRGESRATSQLLVTGTGDGIDITMSQAPSTIFSAMLDVSDFTMLATASAGTAIHVVSDFPNAVSPKYHDLRIGYLGSGSFANGISNALMSNIVVRDVNINSPNSTGFAFQFDGNATFPSITNMFSDIYFWNFATGIQIGNGTSTSYVQGVEITNAQLQQNNGMCVNWNNSTAGFLGDMLLVSNSFCNGSVVANNVEDVVLTGNYFLSGGVNQVSLTTATTYVVSGNTFLANNLANTTGVHIANSHGDVIGNHFYTFLGSNSAAIILDAGSTENLVVDNKCDSCGATPIVNDFGANIIKNNINTSAVYGQAIDNTVVLSTGEQTWRWQVPGSPVFTLEGTVLGWNYAGQGEADWFLSRGLGGPHGYSALWYDATAGTVGTQLMGLTIDGNLVVPGFMQASAGFNTTGNSTVTGPMLFDWQVPAFPTFSNSGMVTGWNHLGQGESDVFLARQAGGPHGYSEVWYDTTAGTIGTQLMGLTIDGNLVIPGTFQSGALGVTGATTLSGALGMKGANGTTSNPGLQIYPTLHADGVTSDDAALQAAVNSCSAVGGTIFLPSGRILLTGGAGTINLHNCAVVGVGTLTGPVASSEYGTEIDLTSTTVTPFTIGSSWSVTGVNFWWPNQTGAVVYPPLMQDAGSSSASGDWFMNDDTIINAYDGIVQTVGASWGRFYITGGNYYAVDDLFRVGGLGDSSHITTVHMTPGPWLNRCGSTSPCKTAIDTGATTNTILHVNGTFGVALTWDNSATFDWRYGIKIDSGANIGQSDFSIDWDGMGTIIDASSGGVYAYQNTFRGSGTANCGATYSYTTNTNVSFHPCFNMGANSSLVISGGSWASLQDFIDLSGGGVSVSNAGIFAGPSANGSGNTYIINATGSAQIYLSGVTAGGNVSDTGSHGIVSTTAAPVRLTVNNVSFQNFNDDIDTKTSPTTIIANSWSIGTTGADSVIFTDSTNPVQWASNAFDAAISPPQALLAPGGLSLGTAGTMTFATSTTGAGTSTFTNSPCTGLTTEQWVAIKITGQSGTWYVPACQ